ncbi:ParB-like protein [Burkholderia multivorans CF2]|nr:ParB-like protein [Burkholderia multivorans CF2]PRE30126.1 hypothetical protein C6P79_06990 [Burkholderia multivorans]PRG17986.1 hypothetical protein C6Q35_28470 [Burkholderia multivorans]
MSVSYADSRITPLPNLPGIVSKMQQKSTSKLLKHTEIRREISLQTRAEINVSTVEEYKEALQGGAKFPPVVTFFDGIYYYLADGWHRYEAYVAARVEEIPADVYKGTRRDAQLYALGANAIHGLRRTNEDKRRAVSMMLEDAEWAAWSDHEIARACKVSQPFVGKLRAALTDNVIGDDASSPSTTLLRASVEDGKPRIYTTRHGTEAVMKTVNIGRHSEPRGGNSRADGKAVNHALADSIAELRGSAALRAPDHPAPVSRDTAEPEPECAAEMAARSCAVDSKRPRTAESDEIIDELREQVSTLADELEEVRGELDAYRAAESGQGEAKLIEANKEIARLKGEIRRLQDRRDDLMNENAELKREVKRLRKQLGYRANG